MRGILEPIKHVQIHTIDVKKTKKIQKKEFENFKFC